MDEYLPPVVTRLRADLSDLLTGLAQARVAMLGWAAGVRDDIASTLRDAGRDWGLSFADSFDEATQEHLQKFDRDVDQNFIPRAAQQFAKAGANSGGTFGTSFMAVAKPLLIGLLITTLPLLTTAVAAAISLGIGFGFIGLGAFLLREQPRLITAATQLKDVTAAVFKDAAMPMLEPMIKALGILKAGMREIGPEFKPIFEEIGGALPNLATGIVGMLREMMPGLKELAPVIGSLITSLALVLPDIGKGLGDLFKSLAESGPAMIVFIQHFGSEFGHLLTIIGKVIVFFGDIFLFLWKIKTMSEEGGWSTPWDAWATGLSKAWDWIKKVAGAAGDWLSGVGGQISATGDTISSKVQGAVERVSGFFGRLLDRVQALPGQIGAKLAALPGQLGDAALKGFDSMLYWTAFGVTRVMQFFALLPDRVRNEAGRLWLLLVDEWVKGVNRSIAFLQTFPIQVLAFFIQLRDGIRNWAAGVVLDLIAWAQSTHEKIVSFVVNMVHEVVAWLDALPGRALKALVAFVTGIKDFFSGAHNWLVQAGRDVVEGLVRGIKASIDAAVDMIRRGMEKIKQGAKDALGIRSPSTVFAAEVGEPIVDGVVVGLERRRSRLQAALGALVSPVTLGTSTAATAALAGQGAALATAGAGSGGGGAVPLYATINVDGQRMIEALVPAAQRRKDRTGTTGLS